MDTSEVTLTSDPYRKARAAGVPDEVIAAVEAQIDEYIGDYLDALGKKLAESNEREAKPKS